MGGDIDLSSMDGMGGNMDFGTASFLYGGTIIGEPRYLDTLRTGTEIVDARSKKYTHPLLEFYKSSTRFPSENVQIVDPLNIQQLFIINP